MSDVVSRVALAIAIVLLVVAGATLLIVIKTEEVPRWLMNLPYTLSLTAVSFQLYHLYRNIKSGKEIVHLRKMRTKSNDKKSWFMPGLQEQRVESEEKDRITSIKNSSKKKKLENPDLSGFFVLCWRS